MRILLPLRSSRVAFSACSPHTITRAARSPGASSHLDDLGGPSQQGHMTTNRGCNDIQSEMLERSVVPAGCGSDCRALKWIAARRHRIPTARQKGTATSLEPSLKPSVVRRQSCELSSTWATWRLGRDGAWRTAEGREVHTIQRAMIRNLRGHTVKTSASPTPVSCSILCAMSAQKCLADREAESAYN